MTQDIIQWITTQGGLAGFAIWMLVQAYKDKEAILLLSSAAAERYALTNREDKVLLLAALDKGTENFAVLNAKLDAFGAALDSSYQRQEAWRNERGAAADAAAAST